MKRRDLLVAGAGAISGCTAVRAEVRWEGSELDALYGRLDRGLASVGNPFQDIAPRARFEPSERAFVESALRSLLLTASFHELPESHRQDPRMTSRLEAHRGDFELGLRGSRAILAMSPAERVTLERAIRRNPSLASEVAGVLGRHARLREVGGAERFELRRLSQRCAWRIQHQPLSLITADTLDRMRKVEGRLGAEWTELRGQVATALAQSSTPCVPSRPGERCDEVFDARSRSSKVETGTIAETLGKRPNPEDVRGKRLMTAGGVTMSGGLTTGGAGVVVAFATFSFIPSVVMCTIGGAAFVVGIILLIYGGVVRANAPDYVGEELEEIEVEIEEEEEWY